MVETVEVQRNKQKMKLVKPPPPTAEEIAAREEAIKAAQAAAAKNKGKNQQQVVIEEPKTPEPQWVEEEPNILDGVFDEEILKSISGP